MAPKELMFAFIKLYAIFDWNENKIDINMLITQFKIFESASDS